jgi:predicted phage terminase large subunit-like protein
MTPAAVTTIRPQPGPQETFLASEADIAIYAGAAGAGKTFAALMSLAYGVNIPGYGAIAFRRTAPELTGPGGIWAESRKLYPSLGGEPRESPTLDWRFPSGAVIEFRHLQHASDAEAHQSKQYDQVLFEEVCTFEESQFWDLFSRLRSVSGVKPFLRATCNPDPDSFVRQLIDWWIDPDTGTIIPERSGVLRWFVRDDDGNLVWSTSKAKLERRFPGKQPKSLTAIRATLDDNQALLAKDPEYRGRLDALPAIKRRRLLHGDWNARVAEGEVFKREWFRQVDGSSVRVVRRIRAWDKAGTKPHEGNKDPDWTRGVLLSLTERGDFLIEDMVSLRDTPGQVMAKIVETAHLDGPDTAIGVWQDPGQAGLADVENMVRELAALGFRVKPIRAAQNKVTYAEIWSPLVEKGAVQIIKAKWTETILREAEAFPKAKHDDTIDALSLAFQLIGRVTNMTRSKQVQVARPYEGESKQSPAVRQWRPGRGALPRKMW